MDEDARADDEVDGSILDSAETVALCHFEMDAWVLSQKSFRFGNHRSGDIQSPDLGVRVRHQHSLDHRPDTASDFHDSRLSW